MTAPRPWTLIAELTYACPLRCAYCSNPPTAQPGLPLSTTDWRRVLREAEQLGVVQAHFTGGEPLLYPDLEQLIAEARRLELYSTLVTSGEPLTRERLVALAEAGLEHVQLSIQSLHAATSRAICGRDLLSQKLAVAAWVKELGLSLTLNVVLTRYNLDEVEELVELAERLGPDRLELAHAQYLGWALLNRDQLLPSVEGVARARVAAEHAKLRLAERGLDVVAVLPDYFAGRPRACMQGWANQYLVVTPTGQLLPCHAAHSLDLRFDDVRSAPLAELWERSPALQLYRGSSWMKEPCASCAHRAEDLAGCRCQAFALTGDAAAADPACALVPTHGLVRAARGKSTDAPLTLRRPPVSPRP